MKKLILLLLILFSTSLFAQRSWFSPKQQRTIDSLFSIVDTLGLGSFSSLGQGKFYIGGANGIAAPRTISGDFTINYLGVGTIGSGKVTNTMLAGSINASKLATGVLDDTELNSLDGYKYATYGTIENRFENILTNDI